MTPATFQAYRAARDANDHDLARRYLSALIIESEHLVAKAAERLARGDLDDLMQAGRMALAKAIEKYDSSRGATLRSYAMRKINEAFYTEVISLRAQVSAGPRWHRTDKHHGLCKMPKAVRRADQAFLARHGRQATAEELRVDADDLAIWRTKLYVEAYDENYADCGDKSVSRVSQEAVVVAAVRDVSHVFSRRIRKVIGSMTAQEQRILYGCVIEELDLATVGQNEGLLRDTTTRIYKKLIGRLRAAIK